MISMEERKHQRFQKNQCMTEKLFPQLTHYL